MAKSMTNSFYIRRTVNVDSDSPVVTSIDTSAYVDPADRQGIMIESVDYIFYNRADNLPLQSASEYITVQLLTGAYTTLQAFDEEDLISSAGLTIDSNGTPSMDQNQFPDVLGSKDGRVVVDDVLSVIGEGRSGLLNGECAIIIKCKVVKLAQKDYMALALQTVAN